MTIELMKIHLSANAISDLILIYTLTHHIAEWDDLNNLAMCLSEIKASSGSPGQRE
jgi:hypothetical protein